ncbi:MAG: TetR/AcrR family transcriptional regulator [Firmicutes bacterium]|nr:TetR/AcrR family transcriptional regulator [Bacillota bacterium]
MAKNNINNEIIIEASARIANRIGLDNLSLKLIAEELNVKSPSLYNYVSSLDSVKQNLMVYGWKQLEEALVDSAVGVTGYEALKNMCNTFYNYATNEKGVFTAMLWYNKYESEITKNATTRLFNTVFKILKPLSISGDNINHIIRTLRSFLEGFALLVNNDAFGNPISIKDSFDLSLTIIMNGIKSLEGVK